MDEENPPEAEKFCAKAGICLESLLAGVNTANTIIPANLFTNGCVTEIMQFVRPKWTQLHAWLTIWMGGRITADIKADRIRRVVQKITEKRKKLMKRSNHAPSQKELRELLYTSFQIDPPMPRGWNLATKETLPTIPTTSAAIVTTSPLKCDPTTSMTSILKTRHSLIPPVASCPTNPPSATFNPQTSSSSFTLSSPVFTPPSSFTTQTSSSSFTLSSPVFTPRSSCTTQTSSSSFTLLSPVFTPPSSCTTQTSSSSFTLSSPVFTPPSSFTTQTSSSFTLSSPVFTPPSSFTTQTSSSFTLSSPVFTQAQVVKTQPNVSFIPSPTNATQSAPPDCDFTVLEKNVWETKCQNTKRKLKNSRNKAWRLTKKVGTLKENIKQWEQKYNKLQRIKLLKIRIPTRDQSMQVETECHYCDTLEEEINELRNSISTDKNNAPVDFRIKNKYNDSFVTCVLTLLDHHVGSSHVSPVIEAVLKLLNVTAVQLPCRSTVEEIGKLRLPLSHLNIAATVAGEEDTTLYSDETRKYGREYETYLLTTTDKKPKFLAIREMKDKAAVTNLNTFKEVLKDIDSVLTSDGESAGKAVLTKIKNTMSDRASTEKSFHEILKQYKEEQIKEVVTHWKDIPEEERDALFRIHNFYCGLHLLVNSADKCQDVLKRHEKEYLEKEDTPTDSSVVNLVRQACKAFSRGGDEKGGVFLPVTTFLTALHKKPSFTNFKGNRFNILFHNASVLYFLHPHILEFLQNCWGATNSLLQTILDGLKCDFNIAGCRSLGLLNHLLTKPFWGLMESRTNILELNHIYTQILNNLRTVLPSDIITGVATLVPCSPPVETPEYTFLITSCDNDVLTMAILEVLLAELADLWARLLKDQVEGGVNFNKTCDQNPECLSVLTHNKLPETVFARLNYEQNRKPSATTYTHESSILYSFNKVGNWLEDMGDDDRSDILKKAVDMRRETYMNFKDRVRTIRNERRKQLEQKQQELTKKRNAALKTREQQTTAIIDDGLWQSEEEIDNKLKEVEYITKTRKLKAVKAQINFRKNVLRQKSEKIHFAFSRNRKPLTVNQLVENLKTLVREAGQVHKHQTSHHLVQENIIHYFDVPSEGDGEEPVRTPYWGKVISQVPGFPAWFNVVYRGEPDVVYTFQLQEDFERGDVSVVGKYAGFSHSWHLGQIPTKTK